MKAVRGAPPGVRVVEIGEPAGVGEPVRVVAAGICASDLRYLARGSDQLIGHELAGVTADGRAVAVEGVARCGACEWCARGNHNLCARAGTDILGMTAPGGMAEYFRVPGSALVPLPAALPLEDAALVEPGAVAWHACRTVGAGMRVAVVGAGAIGLLAAVSAVTRGAGEVAIEAKHTYQREAAERLGFACPSGHYDVVIEASGTERGLFRALELVRPLGTVTTVGVYDPGVTWPYRAALLKEARVVPSMAYGHEGGTSELALVAVMLAERPEIARTLITHRFAIGDAKRAFEVAATRPPGTFKVVVHP